jgi:protoheme IX farnesyltransferase
MRASASTPPKPGILRLYTELSKSGIVALVLISVLGGYLAGQPFERPLSWARLALTLFGVMLLASGSSALNQVQERHEDAAMPRTARRPLPSGRITFGQAVAFVLICLIGGLAVLRYLGLPLALLGALAVISYNGLYTRWWKRRWSFAAVPGAVPGALPVLMGYAAASGQVFAPGGLYLFFLLFFWQMPHFWVLALKYRADYEQGGFPTLPVTHGTPVTVSQIVIWCLGYIGLATLAPLFLGVGAIYGLIAFAVSLKLVWVLRKFVREPESRHWLGFFLWVNFSLVIYIAAAVADLWSVYLIPPLTR